MGLIPFYYLALVDAGAVAQERYLYSPFGLPTILDGTMSVIRTSSSFDVDCLFTGQLYDGATNLHLFRNRYFDSNSGRFVTRDPLKYPDGPNMYAGSFVPSSTDPTGEKPAKQCKINKTLVSLAFDGVNISLSTGGSWPAFSGKPIITSVTKTTFLGTVTETDQLTFDYSTARQGMKNIGPIPEGKWYIETCEQRSSQTNWTMWYANAAWGDYAWSIHPDIGTDTRGRDGFFIHGGDVPGSAGCIDMLRNESQLAAMLNLASIVTGCCCYIPLIVSYKPGLIVTAEYVLTYTDESTVYGP